MGSVTPSHTESTYLTLGSQQTILSRFIMYIDEKTFVNDIPPTKWTQEWQVKSWPVFIASGSTADSFNPGTTLSIDAHGIGAFRLPLPSSEMEISIYHADGSLAYVSKREKRCSGNSVLSHPKLGDLLNTLYFCGPNRDPVIHLLQSPAPETSSVELATKWTSRSTAFVDPVSGKSFEWSYARTKIADGRKVNLIVLRRKEEGEGKGKIVAQLIRDHETRTAGTTKCSAGNGGQLVLDQHASSELDEALIVATCLVMLKRELDRRRAIQFMVLAGAI